VPTHLHTYTRKCARTHMHTHTSALKQGVLRPPAPDEVQTQVVQEPSIYDPDEMNDVTYTNVKYSETDLYYKVAELNGIHVLLLALECETQQPPLQLPQAHTHTHTDTSTGQLAKTTLQRLKQHDTCPVMPRKLLDALLAHPTWSGCTGDEEDAGKCDACDR